MIYRTNSSGSLQRGPHMLLWRKPRYTAESPDVGHDISQFVAQLSDARHFSFSWMPGPIISAATHRKPKLFFFKLAASLFVWNIPAENKCSCSTERPRVLRCECAVKRKLFTRRNLDGTISWRWQTFLEIKATTCMKWTTSDTSWANRDRGRCQNRFLFTMDRHIYRANLAQFRVWGGVTSSIYLPFESLAFLVIYV